MAGDIARAAGRDVAGENDEGNLQIEPLPQFLLELDADHAPLEDIVIGEDEVRSQSSDSSLPKQWARQSV